MAVLGTAGVLIGNLHRKEDYRDTVGKPSRKAHRGTVSEGTPIPGAAGGHGHAERGGSPPGSPLWWGASGGLSGLH